MGQIADDCNLDVDPGEQARALHRVVRAMHDGHCPKCGYLASSEEFYYPQRSRIQPSLSQLGFHKCPSCYFTITTDESKAALAEFRPYLQKSVMVFERWTTYRKYGVNFEVVDVTPPPRPRSPMLPGRVTRSLKYLRLARWRDFFWGAFTTTLPLPVVIYTLLGESQYSAVIHVVTLCLVVITLSLAFMFAEMARRQSREDAK